MDKVSVVLTVFFEEPFWVGVVERVENGRLFVSKVTFGAEPKDYQIQSFFQKNYWKLKFSPAVEASVKEVHANPKRMQRMAKQQTRNMGIGTKSQQAWKLQQEQAKTEYKEMRRARKEAESQRKFQQKQQKKKEKHKGR